ncbi:hypothetical protein [Actinomadura sp. 6N118]|uniref:hypothetical protein n=1 Tax=Actinomadura sp. 6N118 TaxID=3375151 RepID=UPI00379315B5
MRDEVVAAAAPIDPGPLLLTTRTSQLLADLTRAAGPDEQQPDDPVLATARDAVALASAVVAYHATARRAERTGEDARPSLTLAVRMAQQLTNRLAQITNPG